MNKIKAQLEENQNSVMMFWVLGVREREDPMTCARLLACTDGYAVEPITEHDDLS